jgi:hypothetical protein
MRESMTYRELMQFILTLPPSIMEQPVTVSLWSPDTSSTDVAVFPYLSDETDEHPNGRLVLPVKLRAG